VLGASPRKRTSRVFAYPPEPLDAVDVVAAFGKLIFAMINSTMLAVADINQAVVTKPVIRVDDAL
jgi:hypothetical protein